MTFMRPEAITVAVGGPPAARAAARILATQARGILAAAEDILEAAGDTDALAVAKAAGEATTAVIAATYDGPIGDTFACKR